MVIPAINLGYGDLQGDSVKVNFTFPGTYSVKMLVVGAGGIDSLSKTVTTTQPDGDCLNSDYCLGFHSLLYTEDMEAESRRRGI